ncbi:MAG: hypothetical protein EBZ36_15195, partial [Acidobacteria bacterium]|nr:hypothetical protein [Acidobacteriota bacterium]
DITLPTTPVWSRKELLAAEKEALGFYVSGHPLAEYAGTIGRLTRYDSGNIAEGTHGDEVALGGLVVDLTLRTTKKGDRFALFRLEDQLGSVRIVCWPDAYARYREVIGEDKVLLINGRLELSDDGAATLIAQGVQPLETARARATRMVTVRLAESAFRLVSLQRLEQLVSSNPGHTPLVLDLVTTGGLEVRIEPHRSWRISVTSHLIEELEMVDRDWKIDLTIND